jgi:hypothetical protein
MALNRHTIAPTSRLKVISLDDATFVEAQFNPKEISVDKSVPWTKHKESKSESPHLEFTGAEPMSMSFELLFDGAETGDDVQAEIDKLLTMARIIDFSKEELKRPHRVKVIWSDAAPPSDVKARSSATSSLLPFEGVIASVATKYQMFSSAGTPLRAICTLKLTQANQASFKKK